MQIYAPLCHDALLNRADSARCKRRQTLLGGLERAGLDLAVSCMQLQFKGQVLPAFPCVLRQQRRTRSEIGQRGGIGRRRLGALASDQDQLGERLAIVA
jgi:hypothetical protein